ncbi:MAG: YbaN family protein [Spongiibacteraceae bacterium]
MTIYKYLGFLFVIVGSIGAVLPLLPTTPFLLLAAGCFARSSQKWHDWLLSNRVFGPIIFRWEQQRCVSCKTKVVALSSMILMGGYTIFYTLMSPSLMVLEAVLILVGAVVVVSLSTCAKSLAVVIDNK